MIPYTGDMRWVGIAASAGAVALVWGIASGRGTAPPEASVETSRSLLVVLDPGHGGTNTGAPAFVDGVYEKHLTLAVARCVRGRLLDRGMSVELTRDGDRYLSLRQRVRFANERGTDVLVSIHANAADDHAQSGFETFVLSPEALDVDGRALRLDDGPARPGIDGDTARLLDDVERGRSVADAAALAAGIQATLRDARGAHGDRGVRQGAHHVLLGATMPAVLVEIGFIDHAGEGPELLRPAVREAICGAIANAIDEWATRRGGG
jgi:N-acetylmuramoyl-L-alanine amidase